MVWSTFDMDELGPTTRWVATPSSARTAATALLIRELRRAHIFILGAVLTILLAVLLVGAGRTEQDHRPLYALAASFGFIGFLVGCAVAIAHLQRLRSMRAQLPPGLEMASEFGADFMVLRRQWSKSTLHFDGFADAKVVHGWVFLRNRETKTVGMVPEQLFPTHDLARLRVVIAGYQPRGPEARGVPDTEPDDDPEDDPDVPEGDAPQNGDDDQAAG
jgi:hypothetical protein